VKLFNIIIDRREVVSEIIVSCFLRRLDQILEREPNYPVYEFFPKLNTEIVLGSNEANFLLARQIAKGYEAEIRKEHNDNPELKNYHRDTSVKMAQHSMINCLISTVQEISPYNLLLADLIKDIKLNKPSENLSLEYFQQYYNQFCKILQDFMPGFRTYTTVYLFKNESLQPYKGARDVDLEDYNLSGCIGSKTYWGYHDLTPYMGRSGLREKTIVNIGSSYLQDQIKRLMNDPYVISGNAPENFLAGITLTQEDLANEAIMHFINQGLLTENYRFIYNDSTRHKHQICAGLFAGLKVDLNGQNNKELIMILEKIKVIDPKLYESIIT